MLMRLKRDYETLAKTEQQDKVRIKELLVLSEDIENSSSGFNNLRDCRPDSQISKSTMAESPGKKESLAIVKSEKEKAKQKEEFMSKYNRHVS